MDAVSTNPTTFDYVNLGIAVGALVIALCALGWQAAAFLLSGPRVRAEMRFGVNGRRKIVVEHPDGTVHVGIPKPQSTHTTGGPPKFYDYGNFGHVGG